MKRSESAWWSNGFTKDWWKGLDALDREAVLNTLSDEELNEFYHDWRVWARDNQLAPEGIWTTWLLLAGRGFGKTRSGNEWIRDGVETQGWGRFALVGQGKDDIREVMIEGESGLINIANPDMRPIYRPAVGAGRLYYPNGAIGFVCSAADPESLRGPQYEAALFDEPMAVPAEDRAKTVSNLKFGLRLGKRPRLVYTTTPKPHRWLREELAKAQRASIDKATGAELPVEMRRYVLTRGSTFDNAENLPESFFEGIIEDYEGTRLGRQEIYAEILGDEEGALWSEDLLNTCRYQAPTDENDRQAFLKQIAETCDKVVVSVDPNLKAASKTSHEAGVAVVARRGAERFVLDDRSTGGGPSRWARAAITAAQDFGADEIVAESNQGGDMVRMVIQAEAEAQGIMVKIHLTHAQHGKIRRAEPVAAAYERGIVKHVGTSGSTLKPGPFFKLESQMCAIHEGADPTGEDFDRADAVVWGLKRLGLKNKMTGVSTGTGFNIIPFGDYANAANAA